MNYITKKSHPVGSRLLVAWMVKLERPSGADWCCSSAIYSESDQVSEASVVEYSHSGEYVRIKTPESDYIHGSCAGWYPVERIVVKEVLDMVSAQGEIQ